MKAWPRTELPRTFTKMAGRERPSVFMLHSRPVAPTNAPGACWTALAGRRAIRNNAGHAGNTDLCG